MRHHLASLISNPVKPPRFQAHILLSAHAFLCVCVKRMKRMQVEMDLRVLTALSRYSLPLSFLLPLFPSSPPRAPPSSSPLKGAHTLEWIQWENSASSSLTGRQTIIFLKDLLIFSKIWDIA